MDGAFFPRANERDAFGQDPISCFARPGREITRAFVPLFDPRQYVKELQLHLSSTFYPTASKFKCKPEDQLLPFSFFFLSFFFKGPGETSRVGALAFPWSSFCHLPFVGCTG